VQRVVLHVDLDAFYASVEQRDDPSLRGRPVMVGGPPPRGVVAAASYEARRFGVRSAMATAIALQRCPHLVLVRPRMGHYAEISAAFFGILRDCSPLVEGLSLDEAFLDVTGEERLLGDGAAIARRIKDRVRAELRLVASVGVADCKFVAKVASDLGKPDGLVVVPPGGSAAFLAPLPIGRLWGVGEVTEQSLAALGLRAIGDLARAGEAVLTAGLGAVRAAWLLALARGEDDRPVEPERTAVSLGAEETFDVDYRDTADLEPHLLGQADRACARARAHGMRARTITVKVKYADHELVTRRTTLPRPTADGRLVGRIACRLLREVPAIARRGVRLTGVSLSGLEEREAPRQLLFDEKEAERGEALGEALDRIQARFGGGAVRRAVHLGAHETEEDE
jgi:DNA polymerase-4